MKMLSIWRKFINKTNQNLGLLQDPGQDLGQDLEAERVEARHRKGQADVVVGRPLLKEPVEEAEGLVVLREEGKHFSKKMI